MKEKLDTENRKAIVNYRLERAYETIVISPIAIWHW